jgi:hypothetical protein
VHAIVPSSISGFEEQAHEHHDDHVRHRSPSLERTARHHSGAQNQVNAALLAFLQSRAAPLASKERHS